LNIEEKDKRNDLIISYLLITLTMVITYYNHLSATNIYKLIGENLLYYIFKLDYNESLKYNKKIYKENFNYEDFIENNN
jgi:hypothetical protein